MLWQAVRRAPAVAAAHLELAQSAWQLWLRDTGKGNSAGCPPASAVLAATRPAPAHCRAAQEALAEAQVRQALALAPRAAAAHYLLARLLAAQGHRRQAAAEYARVRRLRAAQALAATPPLRR